MKGKPPRYILPVCLCKNPCTHKQKDKQTGYPICGWYSTKTGKYFNCSCQFFIAINYLATYKPSLDQLRKMKYKYIKAGIE